MRLEQAAERGGHGPAAVAEGADADQREDPQPRTDRPAAHLTGVAPPQPRGVRLGLPAEGPVRWLPPDARCWPS